MIGVVEKRCGYTVGHIVEDSTMSKVFGYSVVKSSVLPKPSAWAPSLKDGRGFMSAPDYIGQEVRLSNHLSIVLGWVAE